MNTRRPWFGFLMLLGLFSNSYAENFLVIDSGANDASSSLLSFNSETLSYATVGETGTQGVTDIARGRGNRLYGVTYSSLLRIDCRTGAARTVGPVGFPVIALTVSPDNTLYAATTRGRLLTINRVTGLGTIVGRFGRKLVPAGDLAFAGQRLYGLATSPAYATNVLVRINRLTGRARVIGETGFENVFGLAVDAVGNLYGFREGGGVLSIDAKTGQGLPLLEAASVPPIWGATNSCP